MASSLRSGVAARLPTGSDRLPIALFAAAVALAGPLILFGLGAYHWFFRDEWVFLADRQGQLPDLFEPHGGAHWVAIPRIIYFVLWQGFGVRTYLPYQAVVVALHLSVCVMVLLIMRRSGVGAWLASAAAAILIVFGPGAQNIVWAFQVSFTGSMAYGLVHLLLADHDGSFSRRDWLGLAFGAAALMSSAVGVTMLAVVGVSVLLRRGWRMAACHVGPLVALMGVWVLAANPRNDSPFGRPTVAVLGRWLRASFIGTFEGIGHFSIVAVLVLLVLLIGVALTLGPDRDGTVRERLRELSMPLALFGGAFLFFTTSGLGRWYTGDSGARAGRYVYLGAVFCLPLIAVGAQAIAARWRVATPALVALFLVPIPFNTDGFGAFPFGANYMANRERVLTTAVRMPFAYQVPDDVQPVPDPFSSDAVTMGFLLSAERNGDLTPSTQPLTPATINEFRVRLGVAQRPTDALPLGCTTHEGDLALDPAVGDQYILKAPILISTRQGERPSGPKVRFDPGNGGRALTIELDNLSLLASPPNGQTSFELCEL